MIVNGSYSKLYQRDIDLLNHKLGLNLPSEYADFLLTHNGGRPDKNRFKLRKIRAALDFYVMSLYGLGQKGETGQDLLTMYSFTCESIPHELIAIGSNGIGNLICLGISGEYYGKVYYWYKDGEVGQDETPTFDNIELIAKSFAEFLMHLK